MEACTEACTEASTEAATEASAEASAEACIPPEPRPNPSLTPENLAKLSPGPGVTLQLAAIVEFVAGESTTSGASSPDVASVASSAVSFTARSVFSDMSNMSAAYPAEYQARYLTQHAFEFENQACYDAWNRHSHQLPFGGHAPAIWNNETYHWLEAWLWDQMRGPGVTMHDIAYCGANDHIIVYNERSDVGIIFRVETATAFVCIKKRRVETASGLGVRVPRLVNKLVAAFPASFLSAFPTSDVRFQHV